MCRARSNTAKNQGSGGYAIFEAKSKREAIEWTKRFLSIHGEEWDLECEVRQMEEPFENARTTAA